MRIKNPYAPLSPTRRTSKGSFGEESLEIGLLPLIWGRGTHGKDQISLAETGRWIVVVWGEERGSKEGLSKVYGGGNNSGKPVGWVPRVRLEAAERLVKELGISLADVVRLLCTSTSAISNILQRRSQGSIEQFDSVNHTPPSVIWQSRPSITSL